MEQTNSLSRVLAIANQFPACHLATTEGNQPHVRGLLMWFADETGFYFHTGSTKNLASQIMKNPRVEIAFLKTTNEIGGSEELRVKGEVQILNDSSLTDRLLKERPWVGELGNHLEKHPEVIIFRVVKAEAHIWTMAMNLQEDKIERVRLA